MLTENQMILVELEQFEGTDPTPGATTDFLAVHNVSIRPNLTYHDPAAQDGSLSPRAGVLGQKYIEITFDHELQVDDSIEEVPPCDALLQACGWDDNEESTTVGKYYPASARGLKCTRLLFDAGAAAIAVADTIVGEDSGASATVKAVTQQANSGWGGTTTGVLYVDSITRTPGKADQTTGSGLSDLTMGGTYTGNANTVFIVTLDENGGVAAALGALTDGTGTLNNGTWTGVTMTGGTGTSCEATVVVAGAAISSITPTVYGEDYTVADTLTCSDLAAQGGGGNDDATGDVVTIGDVYSWTQDGGGATSGVLCAIAATEMADGVTLSFAAITGHVKTDAWTITCNDTYENNENLQVSAATKAVMDGTQWVPSVTIWAYQENILWKVVGAKGNVAFNYTAGSPVILSFTMTGEYAKPIDSTFPATWTDSGGAPLVAMNNTFTFGSDHPIIEALTFGLNNTVAVLPSIADTHAVGSVQITNRLPEATINPEVKLATDEDHWTPYEAVTQTALTYSLTNDTVDVDLSIPKCEITNIGKVDRSGIDCWDVTLRPARSASSAGEDEIYLQFKATPP